MATLEEREIFYNRNKEEFEQRLYDDAKEAEEFVNNVWQEYGDPYYVSQSVEKQMMGVKGYAEASSLLTSIFWCDFEIHRYGNYKPIHKLFYNWFNRKYLEVDEADYPYDVKDMLTTDEDIKNGWKDFGGVK